MTNTTRYHDRLLMGDAGNGGLSFGADPAAVPDEGVAAGSHLLLLVVHETTANWRLAMTANILVEAYRMASSGGH